MNDSESAGSRCSRWLSVMAYLYIWIEKSITVISFSWANTEIVKSSNAFHLNINKKTK